MTDSEVTQQEASPEICADITDDEFQESGRPVAAAVRMSWNPDFTVVSSTMSSAAIPAWPQPPHAQHQQLPGYMSEFVPMQSGVGHRHQRGTDAVEVCYQQSVTPSVFNPEHMAQVMPQRYLCESPGDSLLATCIVTKLGYKDSSFAAALFQLCPDGCTSGVRPRPMLCKIT